jgi:hypothetical protein
MAIDRPGRGPPGRGFARCRITLTATEMIPPTDIPLIIDRAMPPPQPLGLMRIRTARARRLRSVDRIRPRAAALLSSAAG